MNSDCKKYKIDYSFFNSFLADLLGEFKLFGVKSKLNLEKADSRSHYYFYYRSAADGWNRFPLFCKSGDARLGLIFVQLFRKDDGQHNERNILLVLKYRIVLEHAQFFHRRRLLRLILSRRLRSMW